jgi:hypothetical protein
MVVRGVFALVVLAPLVLTAGPALAQSSLHSDQVTVSYLVRADIDGHSNLILSGQSAQWYNFDYAVPGRHMGKNNPTIINGTKWYPKWPPLTPNGNCNKCHSSIFTNVMPPVPQEVDAFYFRALSCRDHCSARYSDGVLVLGFNDNPSPGDAWYEVKVFLTTSTRSSP